MINPVEIKVNVDGEVDDALSVLENPEAELEKRQIWFCEDRLGVSQGKLTLLDGGVIIRFRSGERADELTLKLRPCDEAQLVGTWSKSFRKDSFEYRIEGDWSGNRRVMAASAVSSRPPGSLLDAVAPDLDAALAFDHNQRMFFADCARPGVQAIV